MCSQTRNSCAKAFGNRSRSKNLKSKKSRGGQFDPPPSPRPLGLKGYSSGQSHFLEINVKLAEKKEFDTLFVQKRLEMCEKEQNVVLNESLEALGNRSEIVRIFVLVMTTVGDDASGNSFVREACCSGVFRCFRNQLL